MGFWPSDYLDHINLDKSDNRFSNLREATCLQNSKNSGASYGTSKFRGVHFRKEKNVWRSQMRIDGKQRQLGYFDTELDAAICFNYWYKRTLRWRIFAA